MIVPLNAIRDYQSKIGKYEVGFSTEEEVKSIGSLVLGFSRMYHLQYLTAMDLLKGKYNTELTILEGIATDTDTKLTYKLEDDLTVEVYKSNKVNEEDSIEVRGIINDSITNFNQLIGKGVQSDYIYKANVKLYRDSKDNQLYIKIESKDRGIELYTYDVNTCEWDKLDESRSGLFNVAYGLKLRVFDEYKLRMEDGLFIFK